MLNNKHLLIILSFLIGISELPNDPKVPIKIPRNNPTIINTIDRIININ